MSPTGLIARRQLARVTRPVDPGETMGGAGSGFEPAVWLHWGVSRQPRIHNT